MLPEHFGMHSLIKQNTSVEIMWHQESLTPISKGDLKLIKTHKNDETAGCSSMGNHVLREN